MRLIRSHNGRRAILKPRKESLGKKDHGRGSHQVFILAGRGIVHLGYHFGDCLLHPSLALRGCGGGNRDVDRRPRQQARHVMSRKKQNPVTSLALRIASLTSLGFLGLERCAIDRGIWGGTRPVPRQRGAIVRTKPVQGRRTTSSHVFHYFGIV